MGSGARRAPLARTAAEGQVFKQVRHADLVVVFIDGAGAHGQAQVQAAGLGAVLHQAVFQAMGQLAAHHLGRPRQRFLGDGRCAGAQQQWAEQACK